MALFFEELFDYATGASPGVAWDQNKWTTSLVSGGLSQAYNTYGNLIGSGTAHYAGNTAKITPRTGDFEVTFTIQKTSTSFHSNFMMQASGTLAYDTNGTYGYSYNNGYIFYNDGSTGWRLAKRTGATAASITGATLVFGTYSASTWYNVKWRKVGNTHSIRMWLNGTTEPTTWVTGTENATVLAAGVPFVGHRGTMTTRIDNIRADDLVVSQTPVDITILETPATATAMAPEPSVSTTSGVNFLAERAAATATAPEPVVSAVRNPTVNAAVATASATAVMPSVSGSASFLAQAAVATAHAPDPLTTTTRNVSVFEVPATASATAPNATVRVSADVATDFGTYALGTLTGWTARENTQPVIAESASAFSGKWAFYASSSLGKSRLTMNAIAPSNTGEALIRTYKHGGILFGWTSLTNFMSVEYETGSSAGNGFLNLVVNGTVVQTVPVPSASFVRNWLRVQVRDGRVKARIWADGSVEPSTWNLDSAQTPSVGSWGVSTRVAASTAFDYFAVNTHDGGVARNYSLGKEIRAVAATATATAVEPTITAGKTGGYVAEVATASAMSIEPVVTTTHTATVLAEPALAYADAPDATVVSPDVTVSSEPATALAYAPEAVGLGGRDVQVYADVAYATITMPEPTFSNTTHVNMTAEPATATATTPRAVETSTNGADVTVFVTQYSTSSDPFIDIINREFGTKADSGTDLWLRFGQNSPTPLRNYAKPNDPYVGGWSGVPDFGVRDDYFRPATHFEGDSYAVVSYTDYVAYTAMSWETVFRTTDANGPLTSTEHAYSGPVRVTALSIKDGRVTLEVSVFGTPRVYQAIGRVDDGAWHHTLITIGSRGLEIIVDGVSRLLRTVGMGNYAGAATPIEAPPVERIGANSAGTETFSGDILMFAQYDTQLSREAGALHYYAYTLTTVVKAGVATAHAESGNHKGRGNKLRALGLYTVGGDTTRFTADPQQDWTGVRIWSTAGGKIYEVDESPFEWGPYTVYPRKMEMKRDEYDLTPRLFSMDDVEDLSDFDMFFFIDTYEPNQMFNDYENTGRVYNFQPDYENWIASIRRAIDTGISFWCPQPQLALDLGIIDRLETHSLMKEPYDVKTYVEDDAKWRAGVGRYVTDYLDTHYINQYRVTAQVPGFTDLGGSIIEDFAFWVNFGNPYSQRPDYVKWNVTPKPNGLSIGDTMYFPTALEYRGIAEHPDKWARQKVYSVPEGAYRGTAVAREQATYNMNGFEVPNPRVNNVLTIVVQPGDNIKGRPIGGKVLVDFMSGYEVGIDSIAESQFIATQVPPFGPPTNPNEDNYDGYDFDTRRNATFFSWVETVRVIDTKYGTGTKTTSDNIRTPLFSSVSKYPIMFHRQYPWMERILNWLGVKEEVPEGSVRIIAARAEASASAPQPTVTVQKHVSVPAGAPAQALAQAIKPANVIDPDVEIRTLPATAFAEAVQLATIVKAGVATAAAEAPDAQVSAEGQDYVLRLKAFTNATVYLKEDAVV